MMTNKRFLIVMPPIQTVHNAIAWPQPYEKFPVMASRNHGESREARTGIARYPCANGRLAQGKTHL